MGELRAVGDHLVKKRMDLDWAILQVAQHLEASKPALGSWERGEREILMITISINMIRKGQPNRNQNPAFFLLFHRLLR